MQSCPPGRAARRSMSILLSLDIHAHTLLLSALRCQPAWHHALMNFYNNLATFQASKSWENTRSSASGAPAHGLHGAIQILPGRHPGRLPVPG